MGSEVAPKRLRSALWSSETLVTGMKSVKGQQFSMMTLVKDEQDKELALEYEAS